jgi:hypothetical protein
MTTAGFNHVSAGLPTSGRQPEAWDRSATKSEPASAQFTGEDRRLEDEKAGCERRNEAYAAKRISQHGAAVADQEGNERRLIHIAPREMITARDVIELVA